MNTFKDIYKEDLRVADRHSFIVCALFTPDSPHYVLCADRLARSCEKFGLAYSICQVPEIHKSMSPQGKGNAAFSKPNFILWNLERFPGKNVLYLDADIFFMDHPDEIVRVSDAGYDFAVYNWLNDEHNEAYLPMKGKPGQGNRYSEWYVFSHSINFLSTEQMLCSGGVQFYRNSGAAGYLLGEWRSFIAHYPQYADDEALDYVYNNAVPDAPKITSFWLDKSCLRFPWWPHVKPVMLHPSLHPRRERHRIDEIDGRRRYYPERCRKNTSDFIFPTDCVIDTKEHLLMKFENDRLVDRIPIIQEFWIYPEDTGID